jgi:hypothetical protein
MRLGVSTGSIAVPLALRHSLTESGGIKPHKGRGLCRTVAARQQPLARSFEDSSVVMGRVPQQTE